MSETELLPNLIVVASPFGDSRVQNNHSKGHQHWTRDVHHFSRRGDIKALCGRDASNWFINPEYDLAEAHQSRHCCIQCYRAALAATEPKP